MENLIPASINKITKLSLQSRKHWKTMEYVGKHGKTGRIRGKHRKTRGNEENQEKTYKNMGHDQGKT